MKSCSALERETTNTNYFFPRITFLCDSHFPPQSLFPPIAVSTAIGLVRLSFGESSLLLRYAFSNDCITFVIHVTEDLSIGSEMTQKIAYTADRSNG
ncbi:hypothetical protein AVEN_203975-1 [Araneus ventricosus]|uniref:Uncharacterized protein n=1 Tax=Araneus ventricosus TaxID=182803 RepID=A0A4Y2BNF9_ARAVE|nr:hypothetical protein AVEN_88759-1 [Araneus ventricosus]GBO13299.1 hypothetical protein AVEN_203975-1 [Araneus ventricosus]